MKTENDEFRLLEIFRKLNYGEIGDFDLLYRSSKNQLQQIRLCVKKKSPEAAERSKKSRNSRYEHKQRTLSEETIELQGCMFVITSVHRNVLSARDFVIVSNEMAS